MKYSLVLLHLLMLSSGCASTSTLNNTIIKDSSNSSWVASGRIFEDGQTFMLTISSGLDKHSIQGATIANGRQIPWIIIRHPDNRHDVDWLRILEHEGRHAAGKPFLSHNGVKCPCTGFEGRERIVTNEDN